jgi:hypothetical protein
MKLCGVPETRSALTVALSRWNGVISRVPFDSYHTGLPDGTGTGKRSPKPRTPRMAPK